MSPQKYQPQLAGTLFTEGEEPARQGPACEPLNPNNHKLSLLLFQQFPTVTVILDGTQTPFSIISKARHNNTEVTSQI